MKFYVFYRTNEAFRDAMFVTSENIRMTDYVGVACVEADDTEDLFRRMNVVDGSAIEYVGRGKLEDRDDDDCDYDPPSGRGDY